MTRYIQSVTKGKKKVQFSRNSFIGCTNNPLSIEKCSKNRQKYALSYNSSASPMTLLKESTGRRNTGYPSPSKWRACCITGCSMKTRRARAYFWAGALRSLSGRIMSSLTKSIPNGTKAGRCGRRISRNNNAAQEERRTRAARSARTRTEKTNAISQSTI